MSGVLKIGMQVRVLLAELRKSRGAFQRFCFLFLPLKRPMLASWRLNTLTAAVKKKAGILER